MSCNIKINTLDHFKNKDLIDDSRKINLSKYSEFQDEVQKLTTYALKNKNVDLGDLFTEKQVTIKLNKGENVIFRAEPNEEAFEAIQKFNDSNSKQLDLFNLEERGDNVLNANILSINDSIEIDNTDNINKYIFNNKETNLKASDVLQNIISNISELNNESQDLLSRLTLLMGSTDAKVKLVNSDKIDGKLGTYDAKTNSILINKEDFNIQSLEDVVSTIMHETVHSAVHYMFRNRDMANNLDTILARKKIEELYKFYKNNSDNSKSYGFTNIHEFVSEAFSNSKFQEELKTIEMTEKSEFMLKGKNLWERFVSFMRSVLKLKPKYETLLNSITILIKDELPAYYLRNEGLYYKEDIQFDNNTQEQQITKVYEKILNNVIIQSNQLAKYKKQNSQGSKKFKKVLDQLKEDLKKYEELDKLNGIQIYVDNISTQIVKVQSYLQKRQNNKNVKIEYLVNDYKKYELLFNTIPDIQKLIINYKKEFKENHDFIDQLEKNIKSIIGEHSSLKEEKVKLQKDLLLEKLGKPQYVPQVEAEYREKYTKLHKEINSTENLENYISSKMYDNREEIEKKAYDFIDKMINNDKFNISQFELWFQSGMEINSNVVQLFQKILNENIDYVGNEVMKLDHLIATIDTNLKKSKKNTGNPKKIFENIVDVDESGQLYLKGEYKASYITKYNEYMILSKEINDLQDLKQNSDESFNQKELDFKLKNHEKIENDLFKSFTNPISGEKTKIIHPKYKNNLSKLSEQELTALDFFKSQSQINNKLTFSHNSLITGIKNATFYKVPNVPKSDLEYILAGNIKGLTKDKIERITKYKNDEFDYEGVDKKGVELTKKDSYKKKKGNTDGELIREIPLHYRNKGESKDQSYDLSTIYKLEGLNSISYNKKLTSKQLIESFIDIIKEGNTIQTETAGSKIPVINWFSKNKPLAIKEDKSTSNVVLKLNGLLEKNFYDIDKKGSFKIGGADVNKIIGYINGWTGSLGMTLNGFSAMANVTGGYAQVLMHALSNDVIDIKSLKKATSLYHKNFGANIKDLNNTFDKSFTNQINNMFNVFGERNVGTQNYSDDKFHKKFLNTKNLQFMHSMGEHQLQSIVTMAILDKIKGLNKDGNSIEDKSLLDLLKLNNKGILTMDKDVKYTTYSRFTEWDKGGRPVVSDMIKYKIFQVFGNYDSNLQPEIMKMPVGRLLMMYRRFFFPMFMSRYRGVNKAWVDKDNIESYDKYFSYANQRFEEGSYVTTVRYIKNGVIPMVKQLKLDILRIEWGNLNDYEKSNIKKAIIEVIMGQLAFLAASLFAAGADDGDDSLLWFNAWLFKRLESELFQFTKVTEFSRMMRSPFASLRTLDNAVSFWGDVIQPWGWLDQYEGGTRDGEFKILRKLEKQIPVLSRLDTTNKQRYNFLNSSMFGN